MTKSIFKLTNVDSGADVDISKFDNNDFVVVRITKSDFDMLNDMLRENEKLKDDIKRLRQEISMEQQSAIVKKLIERK